MITGWNTDVRYRGMLFHVQTEDSGRQRPHVISHVYHGGTILASEKRGYAERVDAENLDVEVRALMEELHQSMLRRLEAGEFDAVIAERVEGRPSSAPPAEALPPTNVDPPAPEEGAGQRAFGDGLVSAKPLDEVILEYLVDKSRERAGRSARRPRS